MTESCGLRSPSIRIPKPRIEPGRPVHRATPVEQNLHCHCGWGWLFAHAHMQVAANHSLHVSRDGAGHAAEVVVCSEKLIFLILRQRRSLDASCVRHLEYIAADQYHCDEHRDRSRCHLSKSSDIIHYTPVFSLFMRTDILNATVSQARQLNTCNTVNSGRWPCLVQYQVLAFRQLPVAMSTAAGGSLLIM